MTKPNLIYIFADQLRYQSMGYNGDNLACTPNIDAFAKECTVLDNAVSGHPVCAPYRASLLTGKYTTSTGMVINEIRIYPNHVTFANVLNENGYETCYIGKWHLYAAQLGNHLDPKNSFIPPGKDRLGFNDYFAAYNFHHKYYAPFAYYHLNSEEKIMIEGFEPDAQRDMAIKKVNELASRNKPFALFLSLGTPHDPWVPYNVPKEYLDKYKKVKFPLPENYAPKNDKYADRWAKFMPFERRKLNKWKQIYYAMVENLDMNIGKILQAIQDAGLFGNSIVIFTSDHGEMFGAHGRRAKNIFYEEAIRVPFLIKWGFQFQKGNCQTCFNTVDIMPTLLSVMGLPIPQGVQGIDLSQSIKNNEPGEGTLLMGTGPTAIFADGNEWRGFRTNQYTYAVYKRDLNELLFDNVNDPFQKTNLAKNPEYTSIKKTLKSKMFAKMKEIGDDFEKNSFYEKYWVKHRKILPHLARRSEINIETKNKNINT